MNVRFPKVKYKNYEGELEVCSFYASEVSELTAYFRSYGNNICIPLSGYEILKILSKKQLKLGRLI